MIIQGLKNYLYNLKHFFTPLGTFFLGIIIGLSVLIPGAVAIFNNIGLKVGEILNNTNLNFEAFKDSLITSLETLNWTDLDGAIKSIFSYDWLNVTITSAINALAGDLGESANEVSILVNDSINSLIPLLVSFVFFSILGLFLGFFLTRIIVRKQIAERSIFRTILVTIVDSIISVTLISGCIWLVAVWSPSILISSFISIFLFGLVSLVEAYVTQFGRRTKFKKIVNLKNISKLIISNIIILAIGLFFTAIVGYLINWLVALFVGVSFIIISFVVISLNAEAYVKSVAEGELKV